MDGWIVIEFYGILSMQILAHRACKKFKIISKRNGLYKRNYSFTVNIMEEIFEIISCIEILPANSKIYTIDQYTFCS